MVILDSGRRDGVKFEVRRFYLACVYVRRVAPGWLSKLLANSRCGGRKEPGDETGAKSSCGFPCTPTNTLTHTHTHTRKPVCRPPIQTVFHPYKSLTSSDCHYLESSWRPTRLYNDVSPKAFCEFDFAPYDLL